METEQLFTAAKWMILEALSKKNQSPLELSMYVNTSLANISQSLRMLELAGIVVSKRIPNRDKGLPRIVYSLKTDFAFPIIIAKNSARKELMEISKHRKAIMNSWYYPNKKYQAAIEKFLWEIEPQITEIDSLDVEATADTITFNITPQLVANKIKLTTIQTGQNKFTIKITSKNSEKNAYHILVSKIGHGGET